MVAINKITDGQMCSSEMRVMGTIVRVSTEDEMIWRAETVRVSEFSETNIFVARVCAVAGGHVVDTVPGHACVKKRHRGEVDQVQQR